MRCTVLLACLTLSWIATPIGAAAQTSDFENLVEDALGRQETAPGAALPSAVPRRLLRPPAPDLELQLPEPVLREAQPGLRQPDPENPAPQPQIRQAVPLEEAPVRQAAPAAGPKPYTPPRRAVVEPPAEPVGEAEVTPAQGAADQPAPDAATAAEVRQGSAAPVLPGDAPSPTGAERSLSSLTVEEVNAATFQDNATAIKGPSPLVLKAQILLDRAGASPGVIDGIFGGNVAKAIAAVEAVLGLPVDGQLDREVWAALGGDQSSSVLVGYTITAEDAAYPYLPAIPSDYAEQAQLPGLYFTSPQEMFGERFHMDSKLVEALNPVADYRTPGATLVVAAIEGQAVTGKIARIEADKARRQVRAYDAQGRLIVAYPATIGSLQTPSPSGTHTVNTLAPNPVYYYNPENFVQGDNLEKLELPPGPNNPVGTMWIDLSEPGYGIHGTPEPSRIDKTNSNGCVRLTNWDAEELATLVESGVVVSFLE